MTEDGRKRKSLAGMQTLTSSLLLVSAVAGLIMLKSQIEVFRLGEKGPDARTVPALVLGTLVCATLLRLALNRGREENRIGPFLGLVRVLAVASAALVATALMPQVGFFLSAALVGIVTVLAFGGRRIILDLGLTVVLSAVVTYGARHGLNIPLP
jgi:hypothetical protein